LRGFNYSLTSSAKFLLVVKPRSSSFLSGLEAGVGQRKYLQGGALAPLIIFSLGMGVTPIVLALP